MSQRVLVDVSEAPRLCADLNTIIQGGFLENVNQLNSLGGQLSQPDIWDGPKAVEFRDIWSRLGPALTSAQQELEALGRNIDAITAEIMRAGGA